MRVAKFYLPRIAQARVQGGVPHGYVWPYQKVELLREVSGGDRANALSSEPLTLTEVGTMLEIGPYMAG